MTAGCLTLFLGLLGIIVLIVIRVRVVHREEKKLLRSNSEPVYQGY